MKATTFNVEPWERIGYDGLAKFIAQVIVSDVTNRPAFTVDDISIVLSTLTKVVQSLSIEGCIVSLDGICKIYNIRERDVIKIKTAVEFKKAFAAKEKPIFADSVAELCLLPRQKKARDKKIKEQEESSE